MEEKTQILATKKEIKQAIASILTPDLSKRMTKYSIHRLITKFSLKYDISRGLNGITVEDIINDLIFSFLKDNGRNWNKTLHPNIETQIFSALDSALSNAVDKYIKKNTLPLIENFGDDKEHKDFEINNYDKLLDICISKLKELGATDEEILLFEPIIIEGTKRSLIAEEYGITVQEVTNIKKRLDRKIPALQNVLKSMGYEK